MPEFPVVIEAISILVTGSIVREIAEMATEEILVSRVAEGFVTSVNNLGVATVNLGQDDRLKSGVEVLLLRPVWQRDLQELIMVKVGTYSVSEVGARTSTMMPLGDGRARVGDRYLVVDPMGRNDHAPRARG